MINTSLLYRLKQEPTNTLDNFITNRTSSTDANDVINVDAVYENFDKLDVNLYGCENLFLAGSYSKTGHIYGFSDSNSLLTLNLTRNSLSWGKFSASSFTKNDINNPTLENYFYDESSYGYIIEDSYTYGFNMTEIQYEDTTNFPRTNIEMFSNINLNTTINWSDVALIRSADNTNVSHTLGLNGAVGNTNTRKIFTFRYEEIGGYSMRFYLNQTDNIYIDFNTTTDLIYTKNDPTNKIEKVVMKRYKDNIFIKIIAIDMNLSYIVLRNELNQTTFAGDITKGVKLGHFTTTNAPTTNIVPKNYYSKIFTSNPTKQADIFANINLVDDTIYFIKSANKPIQYGTIIGSGSINLNNFIQNDKLYSFGYSKVGKIFIIYNNLLSGSDFIYDSNVLYQSWLNAISDNSFRILLLEAKGILALPYAYKEGYIAGINLETFTLVSIPFTREHTNVVNTWSIYNDDLISFESNQIMYSDKLYNSSKCGYLIEGAHIVHERNGIRLNDDINNYYSLDDNTNEITNSYYIYLNNENNRTNDKFSIISQFFMGVNNYSSDQMFVDNMDNGSRVYYGATITNDTDNKVVNSNTIQNDHWDYVEAQLFYNNEILEDNSHYISISIGSNNIYGDEPVNGKYSFFNNRLVSNKDIAKGNYGRKIIGLNNDASYRIERDHLHTESYKKIYTLSENKKFKYFSYKDVQSVLENDKLYALLLRN